MMIAFKYKTPEDLFDAIHNKIVQLNNLGNAAIKGQLTGGDVKVQNAFDALCDELHAYVAFVGKNFNNA